MRLRLIQSPLVGPSTWTRVAAHLERLGHEVTVPSLTPALVGPPPYWLRQARLAAQSPVAGQWLVAHSGAGPLMGAVSELLDEPPAGYLFVDAGLPHPHKTRLESLPSEFSRQLVGMADEHGMLPPWPDWFDENDLRALVAEPHLTGFVADCPPLPLAMFTEAMPDVRLPPGDCAYLQLSDAYRSEYQKARDLGWPVSKVVGHHLWMVAEPEKTTSAILELIGEVARA